MRYREQLSPTEQIRDVRYEAQRNKSFITWFWPSGINIVFIVRTKENEEISIDRISRENAKLYTKEEYMEFYGYNDRVLEIGIYKYSIYPIVNEGKEMVLINQDNKENQIIVCTGKIKIFYSIKEKRRLLSNRKFIKISIFLEQPISKDLLCYVKKTGTYPASVDDGIMFPFIQDFSVGNNVMPEIEINKDEFIKIFLSDSNLNAGIYEIIYK